MMGNAIVRLMKVAFKGSTIYCMYHNNVRSHVQVNCGFNDVFELSVGVHQGSVLSPILFIVVLEALSMDFQTGSLWE